MINKIIFRLLQQSQSNMTIYIYMIYTGDIFTDITSNIVIYGHIYNEKKK